MTAPNTPALPSASTELAAIRDALAVFPEGWRCAFTAKLEEEYGIVEIGHPWEDDQGLAEVITVDTSTHYDSPAAAKIAAFIMACNPAAMTAVFAYVDALQAEIQALRADARRYRLVRRGQHWSVIDGIGDTLRAETLDAAIDAAVSASGEGGHAD